MVRNRYRILRGAGRLLILAVLALITALGLWSTVIVWVLGGFREARRLGGRR